MKRHDRIILMKILEESDVLATIIYDLSEEQFLTSEDKKRATCMTLINIGELVKNLDIELRMKHNQVPWKEVAGFRDVVSHGYFTLRLPEVWVYASQELPVLKTQIKEILENEEEPD